ncbi:TonB-dependent receptor-like protein [Idiomarina loihiensis]|uniref:TonB-dependent receptor n=1 Tax=Idiomarina TaxID=135575 RepID=UPI000D70C9E2|nr:MULTISPECIES: TonB-dependent receptor [Idiomarina]PWW36938.1 TonB-dependent receptor-like protein [Idiomarina loihiensis]TDP46746.1 TonB-dependent receptor-like protein [Idiomarina loihiensis]TDS23017.1 TonB-dependent receptor-like protein [Idiomarina sp. H2]
MFNSTFKRTAVAAAIAFGLSGAAIAQDTSSVVRGNVVTESGEVAANARVEIIHIPTGTRSVATTNESGAFSNSGLRVGGPYIIVIESSEGKKVYEDVYLSLGEPYRINAQLESSDIERLQVTGSAIIGGANSGSSSYFGEDDIANSPTFNRDLKEVARMNPYVNLLSGSESPLSIGGANPRYNSIAIDGVGVNDDFGLNGNGYPTQRSPISLDAVEQIAVDVAPFDAAEGGFSGGRINAVTKSGTNEFHGSLTYERMSDAWAGDPKNPDGEEVPLDFERDTYSLALGGPIIKDELFFFVNYENSKEPAQIEFGPAGAGAANDSRVTQDEYERVKEIASSQYGIDIGNWDSVKDTENDNLLVKLDWNVSNEHRLALTYNRTEGNNLRNVSSSESSLNLDTNWYDYQQNMELYRLTMFSDWSADLSSELYVSHKAVESISGLVTKDFGDVSVRTENGTLNFGPDSNRHANQLENDNLKIGAKFNYLIGDHEIEFGGEYDKVDVFNIFVRNSLGSWTFESIDDFENGTADTFTYENAYTNNANDAAADFSIGQLNLYVQDNWYLNDTMELGFGIRYERYSSSDKPTLNENFVERYGYSNQENLDGIDIILPRVDFKWFATDDVVIRAGAGRFSGGRPNVWISNSFSNDGYTLVQFDRDAVAESDYLTNQDVSQVPQSVLDSMVAGDGDTNSIDPNYEIPSDWVARLGVDYRFDIPGLGNDFNMTAEVMRKWMTNNSQWKDISRCVAGETAAGVNIYEPCDPTAPSGHYDLMLTNEDKNGKAVIFTASLAKDWDNGFSAFAAYTHQDIEEGNPGTSSTATSNYQYNIVRDRNQELIGTADYQIEHSIKLALGYSTEFFDGYASKFNLFFERRSGTAYSSVLGLYNDGDFGDQQYFQRGSAYLPYIPNGADDPNISPESTISYEDMMANFEAAGLTQYAGGFAPKGTGRSPWVTNMDFQFQQEVPGFMEGHKGMFYITVNNLLNLIDSSKGKTLRQQYTNQAVVDFGGLDSEGRYIYEPVFGGFEDSNWSIFEAEESTWRVKLGVKYSF